MLSMSCVDGTKSPFGNSTSVVELDEKVPAKVMKRVAHIVAAHAHENGDLVARLKANWKKAKHVIHIANQIRTAAGG
jgi:hypothetical protein